MKGRRFGIAASYALGVYVFGFLAAVIAGFVAGRSDYVGTVFYGVLGLFFYALGRIFPRTFSDEAVYSGTRLTAGRVAVFLLMMILLIAGFVLLLATGSGDSHVFMSILALLTGNLVLLDVLERRWAKQDGERCS
jgi:hypothetical protein